MEEKKRITEFCKARELKAYKHPISLKDVEEHTKNGARCKAIKKDISAIAEKERNIQSCLADFKVVEDSCRAYDKSGFHERPSKTCKITLNAPDGRYFKDNKVTVVSEYYRDRKGYTALSAIKPVTVKDGRTVEFSGKIGCTNSRGTGRTCESKAKVRLAAYPDKCFEILKDVSER